MSSLKLTSFTPLNTDTKRKIITIWKSIFDSNDSVEFRNPVDWKGILLSQINKGLGLYDYLKFVQKPMDLNTISKKLREEKYRTVENVLDDIQLIFDNCKIYNIPGSGIYVLAQKIESSFFKMVRNCMPRIVQLNTKSKVHPNYLKQKQTQQLLLNVQSIIQDQHNFYIQQVSYNDKIKFTDKLSHINSQNLQGILKKIIMKCPNVIRIIKPQYQSRQEIAQDNQNLLKHPLNTNNNQIINSNINNNIIEQFNTVNVNNQNPQQSIQNKNKNKNIIENKKQQQEQINNNNSNVNNNNNVIKQQKMQIEQKQQQQIFIQEQKPRRGRRSLNSNSKSNKQQKLTAKQSSNQNCKISLDKMQIGQKLQISVDDLSIHNFQQLMKILQGMVQEKDKVMKKIKLD